MAHRKFIKFVAGLASAGAALAGLASPVLADTAFTSSSPAPQGSCNLPVVCSLPFIGDPVGSTYTCTASGSAHGTSTAENSNNASVTVTVADSGSGTCSSSSSITVNVCVQVATSNIFGVPFGYSNAVCHSVSSTNAANLAAGPYVDTINQTVCQAWYRAEITVTGQSGTSSNSNVLDTQPFTATRLDTGCA
ncbi:MAG: hypothetical protein ABR573_03920 [Candidatus Dormibacteria bacterium]